MSLTSALSSAMTGIYANSKASVVVSENMANALTPGYSRKELPLSATGGGAAGVRTGTVVRVHDPAITASRRTTESEYEASKIKSDFFGNVSDAAGTVDDPYSLAARQSDFSAALVESISRPDSGPRLNELSVKADALVRSITDTSAAVASERLAAENSIDFIVDDVNQSLKQVEKLNARITLAEASGQSTAGLLDQRDQIIDQINVAIPVKTVPRDNGQVALYTEGGAILLDGRASELSFDAKRDITPYMTQDNGLLSGLQLDGRDLNTGTTGHIRGGTLAANFEVRDELAVDAQADLDTMARDLIERFQDPAVDSTLGVTDAGIFTDDGAYFDPVNEVGLASRLQLNEKVSLSGLGETWRFRDGLNAASPGDPGDGSLLHRYSDTLEASRTITSPGLGTINSTAATLSADIISRFAQDTEVAENQTSFAATNFNGMTEMEQANGVDTDVELQQLMIIEQAYAANARVISAVNEMMDAILRI